MNSNKPNCTSAAAYVDKTSYSYDGNLTAIEQLALSLWAIFDPHRMLNEY